MTRSVLILGAGGFIGRHVTAALAASGWAKPIAAGRHIGGDVPAGVETRRLDATVPDEVRAALSGIDAVVNCVAGPPDVLRRTGEVLFDAARLAGEPAIVHLSSMAVYGEATGPVDETAPRTAEQGAYAAAKLAGEDLAAAYPRSVVLRPGCVYGPGGAQWSGRIARLLLAHRIGDLGAGGDGIANLVHARDVAAAVTAALSDDRAMGQAFNLAMPAPPTWNDYFFLFAKELGAVPIVRLSERRLAFESRVLAPPLKIAEILARRIGLTGGPPPIPPSLTRLWRQEIHLVSAKAEERLGLRWTPLAEGLAETAAWYGTAARRAV